MTYEEYITTIAQPYRDYLANGGDIDEYPGGGVRVDADVVCHREVCSQNGVVKHITIPENYNGDYSPHCGFCTDENGFNLRYVDITFTGYKGEAFTS